MAKQLLQKYLWIINKIRTSGRIRLSELQRDWECSAISDGERLPRRTFIYNKEAIQELFDINIECDRRTNEYYIEEPDDLQRQNTINWMLNSFSVYMELADSHTISSRIILEEIPSAHTYLNTVLAAIRANKVLEINYQPFGSDVFAMQMQPYFVQLSGGRWYLYGVRTGEDKIKAFALDRFLSADQCEECFTMPEEFSADEYLQNNGIGQYESIPKCEVIVRAYGKQVDILRTLPLHHSQCETKTEDGRSEFTYNLRPTTRFYGDILSAGKYIKVLSPDFVRKNLAETISKISTYYK